MSAALVKEDQTQMRKQISQQNLYRFKWNTRGDSELWIKRGFTTLHRKQNSNQSSGWKASVQGVCQVNLSHKTFGIQKKLT